MTVSSTVSMILDVKEIRVQEQSVNPAVSFDSAISVSVSARARKFALLLSELCLIAAIVYLFSIESRHHLFPLFLLTIGSFVVHTWLPMKSRLPLFAILSIASVGLMLGIVNGGCVLLAGGALIGLCYLPIGYATQIGLLLAAGTLLVVLRSQWLLPFWAVLGSMFMFRLITFVHECHRTRSRPSLWSSLSYFFLLSNANFPLFPVVDYRVFKETYYKGDDEWVIYQRGVEWIVRGLVHLLLYRFIRSYLIPEYYQLYSVPSIALFMATNYALYVQVSGQFHLITGLLHLFGFNLPRTHNCYFLASSFSDIWRRINIYWKDFLTKFVFFPVFFGLRRRGGSVGTAMTISVFTVFISTWLLHSWQTFWLLGRFPLTINDACLWIGVGATVAVNSLLESRRGNRTEPSKAWAAFSLSARTVGMFALVSIFWSCWTKPGFLSLVGGALGRPGSIQGVLLVASCLAGAIAVGTIIALCVKQSDANVPSKSIFDFGSSTKLHLASLSLVLAITSPQTDNLLGPEIARSLTAFRNDPTAAIGAGERLQSYYEDLNDASVQAGPLISALSPDDESRRAQAQGFFKVSRTADLYQGIDLIPGVEADLDGCRFTVNQFGMRDRRSITFDKEPDTVRVAFVGSSVVMGYGVSDDDVFSRQFENRLNEGRATDSPKIEVLNFGVGKQWPPHRLVRIQRKVMAFDPDVLFYFAHQDEFKECANHTAQLIIHGKRPVSSYLEDVAFNEAKVKPEMPPGEIVSRLAPFEAPLLSAIYRTIVDDCRKRSITPVWIFLPMPDGKPNTSASKFISIAEQAGFAVRDLSDWAPANPVGLLNVDKEYHPNARGHKLITDALIRMAETSPDLLPGFHLKAE